MQRVGVEQVGSKLEAEVRQLDPELVRARSYWSTQNSGAEC